jgi:dolichyl-phosphate-mannose-protein mannosyltransferase
VRDEDLLPLAPTQLSFWSKFVELQWKMLTSRQDMELEHKFSSTPSEWPLSARNIAYWMSPHSNVRESLHSEKKN